MTVAEDVFVPLIGGMALIIATMLTALIPLWSTHRRLGKPNGAGSIAQQIADARELAIAAKSTAEQTRSLAGTAAAASQMAAAMSEANGQKIEDLGGRVASLEREVLLQPGHEVVPPKTGKEN